MRIQKAYRIAQSLEERVDYQTGDPITREDIANARDRLEAASGNDSTFLATRLTSVMKREGIPAANRLR